tara:strand:- start:954 stop:2486 length:1533 start_codon:yes stop_codon:yes gene_type:complete
MHMKTTVSIDDDTLSMVLEHIENDVALVDSMRTCAQISRCAARVLRERHGLESDQLWAYVAAILGKNVFITGGGGCGKSFVSRLIVDAARDRMGDAAVVVCAPTGLAAAAVGGITLDRVMGNRKVRSEWPTGVMSFETFRSMSGAAGDDDDENAFVNDGEVFVPVHSHFAEKRLSAVRIILIDEISMVSAAKLELLFVVLDHYDIELEGVQFVCVGDFAQLKPVCPQASPEARALRGGHFAFRSPAWAELRLVSVPLSVNRRCVHPEWNACLAQLRKGKGLSGSLRECIRGLTATPTTTAEAAAVGSVAIFGKNTPVAAFNNQTFEALPGVARIITAEDSPTSWGAVPKRLPAILRLKVGCSVMVTQNLRDGPHNGASGVVMPSINGLHGGILVAFDDESIGQQRIGALVDRKKIKRGNAEEEGERRQLPLQLAAAFTVHKSQGKSISRPLHVDASTFWQESGMMYVALSRTTDPSTLAIAGLDSAKSYIAPEVISLHESLEALQLPNWA